MPIFLGKRGGLQLRFFGWKTGRLDWRTSFFIQPGTSRCFRTSFDFWASCSDFCVFQRNDFIEKESIWRINTDFNWNDFVKLTKTSGTGGTQIETSLRDFETQEKWLLPKCALWQNFNNSTDENKRLNFRLLKSGIVFNFTFWNFVRLSWSTVVGYFVKDFFVQDFEAMEHPLRQAAVDNPLLLYSVQKQNFLSAYFSGKQHVKGTLIHQLGREHDSVRFRLYLQEIMLFPTLHYQGPHIAGLRDGKEKKVQKYFDLKLHKKTNFFVKHFRCHHTDLMRWLLENLKFWGHHGTH